MKKEIFNKYVDRVCHILDMDEDTLFSRTKKRESVDGRLLLYYLCHKRDMNIVYIQKHMLNKGPNISRSSIYNGIDRAGRMISNDTDYKKTIKDLQDGI